MENEGRDFYSNFVQVTTSLYDVVIQFRVQTPVSIEEDGQAIIESKEACNVRMSPQHAKSLAALLLKHVADYEKDNELNLPVPPQVQEIWDEYFE